MTCSHSSECLRDVVAADALEIQSALLHVAVVATDAILVHDRSHRRTQRSRWTGGGLLRTDGITGHEQNRHPGEETNSPPNRVSMKLTDGNSLFHSSHEA